jgi:transcriptional regulator with XRE-family HTH domain
MEKSIKTDFSKRIRGLRIKHGYTQQQLAELSGMDYKHIQRLESRQSCDVKLTTLEKLAKAFKISISKLLDF